MHRRPWLKKWVVPTVFFFAWAVLAPGSLRGEEKNPLQLAQQAIKAGNYEEAARVLNEYIAKVKDNPKQKKKVVEAYYLLAKMYYEVGDDQKCRESVTQIYRINPQFFRVEADPEFAELVNRVRDELIKTKPEWQIASESKAVEVGKAGGKKKKFPWIIAVAAVVLLSALLYFAVLNRSYTLTVVMGEGVEGFPDGTANYKKNEFVSYQYSPKPGFEDIEVKLDGVRVDSVGSVKMDKNHTLEAVAPTKRAEIDVTSNPPGAQIWLDGVKTEWITPYILSFDVAGTHTVLLRLAGYKEYESTVHAYLGTRFPMTATLEAGHHENFTMAPSNLWTPFGNPAEWRVQDGKYIFAGYESKNWNTLKYAWPTPSYTVNARFLHHLGNYYDRVGILLMTDPNNFTNIRGYLFDFNVCKESSISRVDGVNMVDGSGTGSFALIHETHDDAAIPFGFDYWHELKVVKSGANYTYFINGVQIHSFTDPTYDPRYVVLWVFASAVSTEHWIDYFYVDLGSTAWTPQERGVIPFPARSGGAFKRK